MSPSGQIVERHSLLTFAEGKAFTCEGEEERCEAEVTVPRNASRAC